MKKYRTQIGQILSNDGTARCLIPDDCHAAFMVCANGDSFIINAMPGTYEFNAKSIGELTRIEGRKFFPVTLWTWEGDQALLVVSLLKGLASVAQAAFLDVRSKVPHGSFDEFYDMFSKHISGMQSDEIPLDNRDKVRAATLDAMNIFRNGFRKLPSKSGGGE